MAEFDSTGTLEKIQILAKTIIDHRKNASNSEVSLQYFVSGSYANDAFTMTLLFTELNQSLLMGGTLPEQWEKPTIPSVPRLSAPNYDKCIYGTDGCDCRSHIDIDKRHDLMNFMSR